MWKLGASSNNNRIPIVLTGSSNNTPLIQGNSSPDSNGIVLIPVAERTLDIISVRRYTRALTNSLEPGQYYYDYDSNILYVRIINNNPHIYFFALTPNNAIIKTTCAPNLQTSILSSLNATGKITLQRSFESLPTCSIELHKCSAEFNWCNFINGTPYSLFGMSWIQDNIKITKNKRQTNIDLDLISKHFGKQLDKPIYLKRLACTKGSGLLTLAELAAHIGINYSGENIEIRVDRSMGVDSATTFRQELESRAITKNCFVYYSNDTVTIKKWGETPIHFISPSMLRNREISIDRSGDLAEIEDCLKLTNELRNAQINLDLAEPNNGLQLLISTEGTESAFDVGLPPQLPSTTGIYESALPFETIYNPGICFDNGGKTKKITESWRVRGTETIATEAIYGFVMTSLDVYEPLPTAEKTIPQRKLFPNDQSSFWEKVEETVTLHTFDKDGYLVMTQRTGWRKGRIKKESDQLEAINLQCQILDAGDVSIEEKLTREKSLYLFTETIPINETQFYQLGKLRDYYTDIHKPTDECEPESKFVVRSIKQQFSAIEKTGEDGFPVQAGEWSGSEQRTQITWKYRPEKFATINTSFSSTGANFKDSSAIASYTENAGRPGLQQRLDKSSISFPENTAQEWEQHLGHKYYLVTTGNEEITGTETTLSFPGIDNLVDAKKITETKISIANSKDVEKVIIDLIQYDPTINEGDRISLFGKTYIVFAIDAEFDIVSAGKINCSRFQLSLGRLVKPSVSLIIHNS